MLGKGLVDKSIEIVKIWVTWTCLLRSRPWLWTTSRGTEKCSVACPIRHQELWVQYGRWGVDQLLPVGLSYAWMETSPSGGRWNFVVCVSECFVHFSKAKLLYYYIRMAFRVYTIVPYIPYFILNGAQTIHVASYIFVPRKYFDMIYIRLRS